MRKIIVLFALGLLVTSATTVHADTANNLTPQEIAKIGVLPKSVYDQLVTWRLTNQVRWDGKDVLHLVAISSAKETRSTNLKGMNIPALAKVLGQFEVATVEDMSGKLLIDPIPGAEVEFNTLAIRYQADRLLAMPLHELAASQLAEFNIPRFEGIDSDQVYHAFASRFFALSSFTTRIEEIGKDRKVKVEVIEDSDPRAEVFKTCAGMGNTRLLITGKDQRGRNKELRAWISQALPIFTPPFDPFQRRSRR